MYGGKVVMHTTIEISKPLVGALRMSEPLPNIEEGGNGALRLLYAEQDRPIGYLVEKNARDDAWESLEPRFFITTSHHEALQLLAIPFAEQPAREVPAA
jgi:hypothetical protein